MRLESKHKSIYIYIYIYFFFFAVLGFELRLTHSTSPSPLFYTFTYIVCATFPLIQSFFCVYVKGFFKIGSFELFAWAGFER
jgi:hypothetical protein